MNLKLFIILLFLISLSCNFASDDLNYTVYESASNTQNIFADTTHTFKESEYNSELRNGGFNYYLNYKNKSTQEINKENNQQNTNNINHYKNFKFNVSINDINYGESLKVEGILQNNNNLLINKNILIQHENKTYHTRTNNKGYFKTTINEYNLGLNTLIFLFEENNHSEVTFAQFNVLNNTYTNNQIKDYPPENIEYKQTQPQRDITKTNVTITINTLTCLAGENTNITAQVLDENGNNITGGNIIFKINNITLKDEEGKIKYTNITNGIATINYNIPLQWASKTYSISSIYSGTDIYNPQQSEDQLLTINKRTTNISLSTQQQSKSSENITITVILTDQYVTYDGILKFKFNGKTLKDEWNETIKLNVENQTMQYNYTIPLGLNSGIYNITTTYSSKYYETAENYTNITINKLNTYAKLLTRYSNTSNSHIEIELCDEYNNKLIGTINYIIKIDDAILLAEGATNNSEINIYPERVFPRTAIPITIETYENNKYNYSITHTGIYFFGELVNIETDEIYRCKEANITLNINNVFIKDNTTVTLFLDNNPIYESKVNTSKITICPYIPIEYEGFHKFSFKVFNDGVMNDYASKSINIKSDYIYVNSQGNNSSNGTEYSKPTTLEKALQMTSSDKIIFLTTTNTTDVYHTNMYLNENTTSSQQINIIGEKDKNIIFDGQNNNRLFTISSNNALTLMNINFVRGFSENGGVFLNFGNLTLINTTLSDNHALTTAGVIYNTGNLTLINNHIFNNGLLNDTRDLTDSATTANGGVINSEEGDLILLNNTIYGNKAQYGGIISVLNEYANLMDNKFFDNIASYSGGVLYSTNSTIFSYHNLYKNNTAQYGSIIININSLTYTLNDTYIDNRARTYGALLIINSTTEVYKVKFENNNATYGAALYSINSNVLLNNSYFYKNIAIVHGGGISSINSTMNINNTKFNNNMVNGGVGASIYSERTNLYVGTSVFKKNSARLGGSICVLDEDISFLENNEFKENTAEEGGAIFTVKSNLYINNNTFNKNYAKKGGAILSLLSYTLNVEDSHFQLNNALTCTDIYSLESITNINNNNFYSNITKNRVVVDKFTSNIDGNYWGNNNPNFNIITNNTKPIKWKIIENNTIITVYNNETDNENSKILNNITITTNNTNNAITIKAKKKINVDASDIVSAINENLSINISFSEKITAEVIVELPNGTIINKYVNNSNQTTINYFTPSMFKMEKITVIIPETDEYEFISKNINIFVQNSTSYFNLLDYGLVTPVKNQLRSPTCWAFSSLSSLESSIIKEYNQTYDFSENHLKNIINKYSIVGTDTGANEGSSLLRPVNYMVSWYEPVLENQDVFYDESTISSIMDSVFHVQDVMLIKETPIDDISEYKKYILKYGAIFTDFNSEGACDLNLVTYNNETFLNTVNYYSYNEKSPNHAITIIGWDDNYSRYNFNNSGYIPQADGAFIVKNSWGVANGINGIIYISYYDKSLAIRGSVAFSMENKNNYESIYQHESCSVSTINSNSSIVYIANRYQSTKNEEIQAVGTFFYDESDYIVTIYKNGIEQYTQNGHVSIASYKTIQLNEYVPLIKGDNFTAIIKITSDNNTKIIVQDMQNMTSKIITQDSFISFDGLTWTNLYNYQFTACLKVYTGNSYITTFNNRITHGVINSVIHDNKPTNIPLIVNKTFENTNYTLAHYIIKVPTVREVVENNTLVNKTLKRSFHLLLNGEIISLSNVNFELGFLISKEGEIVSNDYQEIEGIYIKKDLQDNYIEINCMFNLTDDLNKVYIRSLSYVNYMQGQVNLLSLINNGHEEFMLRIFIPRNGTTSYFDEKIITNFIFNNQNVERIESLKYYSFDQINSFNQTYLVSNVKLNNETYINWTNNLGFIGDEQSRMALNTLYLNDAFADFFSSILNVTWNREDYAVVLCGYSDNSTYVHVSDPTMGMIVYGENDNKVLFRFLTTYLLPLYEEKSLGMYNYSVESALSKIIKSLDDDSFRVFEENNTIIFVVNDDTNTTIKIDGDTGIVSDYIQWGDNVYHGLFSDDQHNLVGFEVGSSEAELERLVGSTIMASSGYLLAVPAIGHILAPAVFMGGFVICADGCGVINVNQYDNISRLYDLGWDVATSFPYSHALGFLTKVEKLSGIVSRLEEIDRIAITLENSIKSSTRELFSFMDDATIDLFKETTNKIGLDMFGINKLTQNIIISYCESLNLAIPRKEFSRLFTFNFEIDKKALFEGSHLIQANHEIFCKRINQIPNHATEIAYISYGLTKTLQEQLVEHATDEITGFPTILKNKVEELFISSLNVDSVKRKRENSFTVDSWEYSYVEKIDNNYWSVAL